MADNGDNSGTVLPDGPQPKLSEKEVVLLGLVAEEPLHAYGLEEKIRTRRMTEWTDIGFSSIYRVLDGLEQRGLIEFRLAHEGPGATRKVHHINDCGRKALAQGVLQFLGHLEPVKNPVAVGLAFITCASHAEVMATMRSRQHALTAMQEEVTGLLHKHDTDLGQSNDLPARRKAQGQVKIRVLFEHVQRHLQAELEAVHATIDYLEGVGPELFGDEGSERAAAGSLPGHEPKTGELT